MNHLRVVASWIAVVSGSLFCSAGCLAPESEVESESESESDVARQPLTETETKETVKGGDTVEDDAGTNDLAKSTYCGGGFVEGDTVETTQICRYCQDYDTKCKEDARGVPTCTLVPVGGAYKNCDEDTVFGWQK